MSKLFDRITKSQMTICQNKSSLKYAEFILDNYLTFKIRPFESAPLI